MPRPKGSFKAVPSYRHHKPSGRAVVTLGGQNRYLGIYGTRKSRDAYDQLVGEWLAHGRGGVEGHLEVELGRAISTPTG
jgi:hypothetical protein